MILTLVLFSNSSFVVDRLLSAMIGLDSDCLLLVVSAYA